MKMAFSNQDSWLRRALLSSLAQACKLAPSRFSDEERNRVQFLLLHDVPEKDLERFRRLLEALEKKYRFIGYSEAVERVIEGRIDERYLAVSFDDGFLSCRAAVKVMNELGIAGCFFICPSIIGETDERKIREFCEHRLNERVSTPFLNWSDLENFAAQGHEIGAHSMNHANLAQCGPGQLCAEIQGCYEVLSRRFGTMRHFAWPFGHFPEISAQAASFVFHAGFRSCASGERGCHITGAAGNPESLCIRRDLVKADWPLSHVEFFLARNAKRASASNNRWPLEAAEFAPEAAAVRS